MNLAAKCVPLRSSDRLLQRILQLLCTTTVVGLMRWENHGWQLELGENVNLRVVRPLMKTTRAKLFVVDLSLIHI